MRHGNHNRKFGRERNQRRALLNSLAENLIKHSRIETTEAKAKELRPFVEKLITRARADTVANRRLLISKLGTATRMKNFVGVASRYINRRGGYTRIVKLPRRTSDGSPRAIIELV